MGVPETLRNSLAAVVSCIPEALEEAGSNIGAQIEERKGAVLMREPVLSRTRKIGRRKTRLVNSKPGSGMLTRSRNTQC